jgi:hypothetical protein
MTSQLQVPDAVVNKPFKHLKQLYSGTLLTGDHTLIRARRIYKHSVTCHGFVTAWQEISPEVTVKGHMKCCISYTTDRTDDSMLWNDGRKGGNVGRECEEDEGTDCEDGRQ